MVEIFEQCSKDFGVRDLGSKPQFSTYRMGLSMLAHLSEPQFPYLQIIISIF